MVCILSWKSAFNTFLAKVAMHIIAGNTYYSACNKSIMYVLPKCIMYPKVQWEFQTRKITVRMLKACAAYYCSYL